MNAIKPLLVEFVDWLESTCCNRNNSTASEFALEPPAEALNMAEIAMEAAISSGQPVWFSTHAPIRSIVGALVRRRARITLDDLFQDRLTDQQFDSLEYVLRSMKNVRLLIDGI